MRLNKAAIVTGGTRGLGKFISIGLARKGFSVVATYKSNRTMADGLLDEAKQEGLKIAVQSLDLNSFESISTFFKNQQFNDVGILVNNASPAFELKHFSKWDLKKLDELWTANVRGTFQLTQAVVPLMKMNGGGTIINILSSVVEGRPPAGMSGYTVAKYGLLGLTKAMAVELSKFNISVHSFEPGFLDCGFSQEWHEHLRDLLSQKSNHKFTGETLARQIVSVCCETSSVIETPIPEVNAP